MLSPHKRLPRRVCRRQVLSDGLVRIGERRREDPLDLDWSLKATRSCLSIFAIGTEGKKLMDLVPTMAGTDPVPLRARFHRSCPQSCQAGTFEIIERIMDDEGRRDNSCGVCVGGAEALH